MALQRGHGARSLVLALPIACGLLPAVALGQSQSASPSSGKPPPTTVPEPSGPKLSQDAVIALWTIGAVVIVMLAATLFLLYMRRRKRMQPPADDDGTESFYEAGFPKDGTAPMPMSAMPLSAIPQIHSPGGASPFPPGTPGMASPYPMSALASPMIPTSPASRTAFVQLAGKLFKNKPTYTFPPSMDPLEVESEFIPFDAGQIRLGYGHQVKLQIAFRDGWGFGLNENTKEDGLFPLEHLRVIGTFNPDSLPLYTPTWEAASFVPPGLQAGPSLVPPGLQAGPSRPSPLSNLVAQSSPISPAAPTEEEAPVSTWSCAARLSRLPRSTSTRYMQPPPAPPPRTTPTHKRRASQPHRAPPTQPSSSPPPRPRPTSSHATLGTGAGTGSGADTVTQVAESESTDNVLVQNIKSVITDIEHRQNARRSMAFPRSPMEGSADGAEWERERA
ncbi:hypothetical protein M427DRAFT_384802 [Gonapodya prolifera JEL478]|uniref:SH3 domain-containing protein n=1 Tax=Gonapodya prolifera (strain JEL478) TaxID=1344416 RepID=A0A139A8B7_GONPJ|nr:hypothetical protein M427DRAFT_384802 [Gonapodya prolifera JEL478]|eukprot:KXS13042.1 hypothetical protein M427DRAFT_384802 [Gonapodya prolifera JEL478]